MIDSHCHLNFESLAKNDKIIYNSKNNITSLLSINITKDFENHISLIKNHKEFISLMAYILVKLTH